MLYSILFVFGAIFSILGAFIVFASVIGFIRNDDFFIKVQAVSVSNLYGINLMILGEILRNFSFKGLLMVLVIIVINIASSLIVIHSVTRSAFIENVKTNAINRRNLGKK